MSNFLQVKHNVKISSGKAESKVSSDDKCHIFFKGGIMSKFIYLKHNAKNSSGKE